MANIPVVPNIDLPAELQALDQRRIICLTMQPARLEIIRRERRLRVNLSEQADYSDLEHIIQEVNEALRLYNRRGWMVVDVTFKSVEEAATEIMRLIYTRRGLKKGNIQI